jgi:hypothetical protein
MEHRNTPDHNQNRMIRPTGLRSLAPVERAAPRVVMPADRSFKVLKSSHAPAQLSLFPPRGATVTGTR